MTQTDFLEEEVACFQLGRTKATLRKYAREHKIKTFKKRT